MSCFRSTFILTKEFKMKIKNSIPLITSVLLSLSCAAADLTVKERENDSGQHITHMNGPTVEELGKWETQAKDKYDKHKKSWCFDCKKPKTIGDMHISGDCTKALRWKTVMGNIEKARAGWGQDPRLDSSRLGEIEISLTGKWIEGVGYDLVLRWDEQQNRYLIEKRH
jgi:hypothetical protein